MSTTNKSVVTARAQGLIAGITKHFSTAATLAFGNATYTPTALTQLLQSFVATLAGVDAAKATYQAKQKAAQTQTTSMRSVMSAFTSFVRATFGDNLEVLTDFDLSPVRAKASKTVQEKVVVVAKALATRELRHTTGKRQKAKLRATAPEAPTTTTAAPATSTVSTTKS